MKYWYCFAVLNLYIANLTFIIQLIINYFNAHELVIHSLKFLTYPGDDYTV